MANDDESNYSGIRYLMDAKNSRQYALLYSHGTAGRPHVFAEDIRDDGFKPNETIFAFDDRTEDGDPLSISSTGTLSTTAYQILTDGTAKPTRVIATDVTYALAYNNATGAVRYEMTPDSVQNLLAAGFSPNFPRSFTSSRPIPHPSMAQDLPFPPHQSAGYAAIARQAMDPDTSRKIDLPTPVPTPARNTEQRKNAPNPANPLPRPANDFGKVAPAPVRYNVSDTVIEGLIKQYCKDLTEEARQNRLDPVIGRDSEITQALNVLNRRKRSSLCFTGEAGVGKTALFDGIAQRLVTDQNLPERLQGARVLQLDLQAMNAGAMFRGQFEGKLKPLIDGLQERQGMLKGRKIIIAIDEIHSQLTSGKAEGGTDAGNIMKPFLTSKGISVMGTTTFDEYKKHIEKDAALGRRFEEVPVKEPDEATINVIVEKLMPLALEYNHLTQGLTKEDIRYIVTMTNRYAPQEAQPSKAVAVLDMASSSAEMRGSASIEKQDILAAIAQMSKLPMEFLDKSDTERFRRLKTELPEKVMGQPGLDRIANGLIGARMGLTNPEQPWGCFVLQGPTGTGKTETCKALAEILFGDKDAIVRIDMAKYADKHSGSGLLGAPPGFVGHENTEPELTEKIRKKPYCILLLDEIEKAHPDVFNVLLPIFEHGKITDSQGKLTQFNNVIIVMTTNVGATKAIEFLNKGGKPSGVGFGGGGSGKEMSQEEIEKGLSRIYGDAIMTLFRPEMVNRINVLGGFITYIPLTQGIIAGLVDRELDKVNAQLQSRAGVNLPEASLSFSDEVKAQLARDGYNPAMGARPLATVVREKIINPMAWWLMDNKDKLLDFIAEHGAATLVIDNLAKFNPQIVTTKAVVAVSNDNAAQAAKTPAKKQGKAPKPNAP